MRGQAAAAPIAEGLRWRAEIDDTALVPAADPTSGSMTMTVSTRGGSVASR